MGSTITKNSGVMATPYSSTSKVQFAFLQLFQFAEQNEPIPQKHQTAEAISQRREQFTEQVSVKQPHGAEIKRRTALLPIELTSGKILRCGASEL